MKFLWQKTYKSYELRGRQNRFFRSNTNYLQWLELMELFN